MDNRDLGDHPLTKWSEPWRDELESYLEDLFSDEGRDVDLHFQEEHVAARDRFGDLEEIFLPAPIVVVNQEAARVPIIFRIVKHLKLHECRLTSLHARQVCIFRYVFLLGDVLHVRQVPDRAAFLASKDP